MRRIEGPPRPAYDYAPTTAHRPAREDVPARLTSHSSRPVLAPSSRRASDQDLVLPSVEREPGAPSETPLDRHRRGESLNYPDVQTPKRKSYPSSVYSPQEPYVEQVAKRLRPVFDEPYAQSRPRMSHPYQPTNLPSSPMRPANGGQREVYAASSSQPYTLASARDPPRAHVHEYGRPYSGRAIAPAEYSANRVDAARYPVEDGRYRLH
jgi:hypothetical protein